MGVEQVLLPLAAVDLVCLLGVEPHDGRQNLRDEEDGQAFAKRGGFLLGKRCRRCRSLSSGNPTRRPRPRLL